MAVLAARYGAAARVVWPADARLCELGVVHRGLRGDRGIARADCEAARPDALRVDGEASDRRRKDEANGGFDACHPFLRRSAGRALHHEGRQTHRAQTNSGVRAR